MPNTAARRRAIRRIVSSQPIGSQSVLAQQLAQAGFDVTQATVSRDLRELGAVKGRDPEGGAVYVLPGSGETHDETAARKALRRALVEYAETIVPTANLVLVKTPPGAAQVVAAAVDGGGIEGVLGTVAGDDTLLVVVDDQTGGWRVATDLERIGGDQ